MEENRKKFLHKILEWFVNDTEIHPYVRTWFPSFLQDMENYPISLRPLDISNLSLFPIVRFYDYCRKTYDLSVEEIEYIWHKYTIIIIDKFNNEKPLNESEDKLEKYFNYVIDDLVKMDPVDVIKCIDFSLESEYISNTTKAHIECIRKSIEEIPFTIEN